MVLAEVVKVSVLFVMVCRVSKWYLDRQMSTNFENYKDYHRRLVDMWIVGSGANAADSHRRPIRLGNFFSIQWNSVWVVDRRNDHLCYCMRNLRC